MGTSTNSLLCSKYKGINARQRERLTTQLGEGLWNKMNNFIALKNKTVTTCKTASLPKFWAFCSMTTELLHSSFTCCLTIASLTFSLTIALNNLLLTLSLNTSHWNCSESKQEDCSTNAKSSPITRGVQWCHYRILKKWLYYPLISFVVNQTPTIYM